MATTVEKVKKTRQKPAILPEYYNSDLHDYEVGIDEAGRGPLFGRVYVAGVVLPKDGSMDMTYIRDSKKLTKKKLEEMYLYIQSKAIVYHVAYIEADEIDAINIRESVLKGMRECAIQCVQKLSSTVGSSTNNTIPYFLCVDGKDCPACHVDGELIPGKTFVNGDNTIGSIAAASIMAKVSRDHYILDLCKENPELSELYKMDKHKGYGTKAHMEAIQKYGITKYHRKTFGRGIPSPLPPVPQRASEASPHE